MTQPIQLHVGYVGITREGKRVEIIEETLMPDYHFMSNEYNSYCRGGNYWLDKAASDQDIVGPWVETPVEPLVDYNDGKWHRWSGGECPVHLDSVVEVMFIGLSSVNDFELNARSFTWDSVHAPIVAFRVTKEHVEPPKAPREFWLLSGKIYSYYPVNPDTVHVREVLIDD
jgi:hypothetical protein